jgi:prevent-host-death family protein
MVHSSPERGPSIEEIAISKFKATCLAILERVRKTHKPVRITRFGKPIANVVPPPAAVKPPGWMGSMAGSAQIKGNIIDPATDEQDWDALRS